MSLAVALLALALAAPAEAGAQAVATRAGSVVEVPAASLTPDQSRPTRARAPIAPPLRRLLRKRDVLAPVRVLGGRDVRDTSLSLLALELSRNSSSLIVRARSGSSGPHLPLRLLLAGLHGHTLHTPPPSRPG